MALNADQWGAIRKAWEYDPDQPTYAVAAKRAADKHGFKPPTKQSVAERARREGWERLNVGSMAGVNAAAQRKADHLPPPGGADGGSPVGPDARPDGQPVGSGAKKAADPAATVSSTEEAGDLRAQILSRHREEARIVGALVAEALARRPQLVNGKVPPGQMDKVKEAFEAMKLAKITSEALANKQMLERKAWGLDIVIDPDQLRNLSDEDLERLAAGKPLK